MRTPLMLAALVAAAAGPSPQGAPAPDAFAIRDVRVFDGEGVIDRATVVVQDGRIQNVGPAWLAADGRASASQIERVGVSP